MAMMTSEEILMRAAAPMLLEACELVLAEATIEMPTKVYEAVKRAVRVAKGRDADAYDEDAPQVCSWCRSGTHARCQATREFPCVCRRCAREEG